jgi:hypothetical protein
MQMDVQNMQIVMRRSKSGLPGSRTCTKHIVTPRTAVILLQRRSEIKKNSRTEHWMGFYAPGQHFSTTVTVQPIPLVRSLPVADEGAFTALPSPVVSVAEESELLNRIQKIVKNLPDSVPIASSQDRLTVFSYDPHLLAENGDDLWEDTLNSFLKDALG